METKGGPGHPNTDPKCLGCGKSKEQVGTLICNPAGTLHICDECTAICNSILEDRRTGCTTGSLNDMKQLAVMVYNHCNPHVHRLRDAGVQLREVNILIIGPTGALRMLMGRTIAWILRIPCRKLCLPVPLYLILGPSRRTLPRKR
jgi:ATP-dependent Clp protease ATP-binding subunit ClpX